MTPKLSFVVPFYQVEDYFEECLDSIAAQTLEDFECVLVDDGSMDGSLAIAEKFAETDPRFRIVRQPNAGLGPARNTGVRQARGEYLMFLDSDDVIPPKAAEILVSSLEKTGSDLAAGNAFRFGTPAGVVQSWTHAEPMAVTREGTHILEFLPLVRDRMAWNKVFRRSFWDAQGFEFPAIRYEDYPVTLPAHVQAESVDVLADHIYYWRERVSKDSITQQAANVDNALDRVASATMVLDYLDDQIGTDLPRAERLRALRSALSNYLYLTDMVSLVESWASAAPVDQRRLLPKAQAYARRIQPGVLPERDFLRPQIFAALVRGDENAMAVLLRLRARDRQGFWAARPNPVTLARLAFAYGGRFLGRVRRAVARRLGQDSGATQ